MDRFILKASVGAGAENRPADVRSLRGRLLDLGYPVSLTRDETELRRCIDLVQSIVRGRNQVWGDGRIDVPGQTYEWLRRVNAPRWQRMSAGSDQEGFINVELEDETDHHDWGTDWLDTMIRRIGARYQVQHRHVTPSASPLAVNDTSLVLGGRTRDHQGHQTGLATDLLLPRQDGSYGGVTWRESHLYDRTTARHQLEAIQAFRTSRPGEAWVQAVYFNDPDLVASGLCSPLNGHDNHIHIELHPPERGDVEALP